MGCGLQANDDIVCIWESELDGWVSVCTSGLRECIRVDLEGVWKADWEEADWWTGRVDWLTGWEGVLVYWKSRLVAWYTGEVKEGSSKTINHLNPLLGLGVWNERSALPCQGYFSPHSASLIHSSSLHSASSPNSLFFITSLFCEESMLDP